ncbi:MAG: hypothetical protein ACREAA_21785 [Candidatus Polarisedimenticolia bacterium]
MRKASLLAAALCLTVVTVLMGQEPAGEMAKPLSKFTIGDLFPKIDAGLEQTAATWKTASSELQTKTAARQKAVTEGAAAVKVKSDQLKAEAKAAKASKDFTAQGTAEGKLQTEEVVNKILARLQTLATEQKETADVWNRTANAMSAYVQADKEFDQYRSKGISKPESGAAAGTDNRLDQAGVQAFKKHTESMDELGKSFAALGTQIQGMSSGRMKFLSELEKGGHIQPPPPK